MLIALLLMLAGQVRPDGGVYAQPHADPRTLTEAQVDPLMWPIVSAINKSGWVWTTDSCEGHDGRWPSTLGVVTDDLGRFVQALASAQATVFASQASFEIQDPHGWHGMVQFFVRSRLPRYGAYQIRLMAPVAKQRETLAVWARTAQIVLE